MKRILALTLAVSSLAVTHGQEEETPKTAIHEIDGRTITIEQVSAAEMPIPQKATPPQTEPLAVDPGFPPSATVTHFITLAATVHENGTHLKWTDPGTGQKIEAWSKVNWAHFNTHTVLPMNADEQLTIMVLAGNTGSVNLEMPQIPQGEDFVLITDTQPCSSVSCLEFAHRYYTQNCAEIIKRYEARCVEQERRRAETLANPPVPKDVIIRARVLTDEEVSLLK